jgi:hypothetical protein
MASVIPNEINPTPKPTIPAIIAVTQHQSKIANKNIVILLK